VLKIISTIGLVQNNNINYRVRLEKENPVKTTLKNKNNTLIIIFFFLNVVVITKQEFLQELKLV